MKWTKEQAELIIKKAISHAIMYSKYFYEGDESDALDVVKQFITSPPLTDDSNKIAGFCCLNCKDEIKDELGGNRATFCNKCLEQFAKLQSDMEKKKIKLQPKCPQCGDRTRHCKKCKLTYTRRHEWKQMGVYDG